MTTIRQACEAVLNASPSDYEAACEVWTKTCTPQAVRAALKQLETERDAARRHLGDALSDAKRLADDAWKAAAEAAALREAAGTLFDAIAHGDEEHREWLRTAIAAHFATPPSAAVQRVQGIVAAAERVLVEYDLLLRQQPSLATTTIPYQPYEALRAALNGNEVE